MPINPISILVVDDNIQIRRVLRSILTARGYLVQLAETGEQALDLSAEQPPDLIILDLTLPGIGGLDVCRELREWFRGPILILSVNTKDADKVAALDLGADDYLTKPFSSSELLARIRALLRRVENRFSLPKIIHFGDVDIDLSRRVVTRAGEYIALTPLEYGILAYLARNANCVVTSNQLIDEVWGDDAPGDTQALRVHISHLRKKIEKDPTVPQFLLTEPGVGFRLSVE